MLIITKANGICRGIIPITALTFFVVLSIAGSLKDYEPDGELYEKAKSQIDKSKKDHAFFSIQHNVEYNIKDINRLSELSPDIIVGRVLSNRLYINENKNDLYTLYRVLTRTVYKGEIKLGGIIELEMPGGVWRYNDGTIVVKRSAHEGSLEDGKDYFLFIRQNKKKHMITYLPIIDTHSIYCIDWDEMTINPLNNSKNSDLEKNYEKANFGDFIKEFNKRK